MGHEILKIELILYLSEKQYIPHVVLVGITRGFDRNHVRFWVEPHVVFYFIQNQPVIFLKPASFSADKIRVPGL